MTAPMSDERLAEIKAAVDRERWSTYCGHVGPRTMVTDLLAEVGRLNTQAAYMREQIEQLAQVNEERKARTAVYRALAEEHQKRGDKLSAQLVEAGETRDALAVAMELLDRLADGAECWLDQHGYCQRYSQHKTPCPHPLAMQVVAAWREVEREVRDA